MLCGRHRETPARSDTGSAGRSLYVHKTCTVIIKLVQACRWSGTIFWQLEDGGLAWENVIWLGLSDLKVSCEIQRWDRKASKWELMPSDSTKLIWTGRRDLMGMSCASRCEAKSGDAGLSLLLWRNVPCPLVRPWSYRTKPHRRRVGFKIVTSSSYHLSQWGNRCPAGRHRFWRRHSWLLGRRPWRCDRFRWGWMSTRAFLSSWWKS